MERVPGSRSSKNASDILRFDFVLFSFGYSGVSTSVYQVNLTLDAYLDGTLFNSISKDSYQLLAHGREADMVTSIWS